MQFDDNFSSFAEPDFVPILSIDEDAEKLRNINVKDIEDEIAVLPLRNTVLFPSVVMPITIGRERSVKAVKEAHRDNKLIMVVSQKDSQIEDPEIEHLNEKGTIAKILRTLQMPDGSTTAIIQGVSRAAVLHFNNEGKYLKAKVKQLLDEDIEDESNLKVHIEAIRDTAIKIIEFSPNIPNEASFVIKNINNHEHLLHFIIGNIDAEMNKKQEILEIDSIEARANKVFEILKERLMLAEVKNQIHSKVRNDIDKQQREFFLNQQLKTIHEELGNDNPDNAINALSEKAAKMKWSENVKAHFDKELNKLRRINPAAADYSTHFNYLETILDLPWNQSSKDNFDLKNAKKILDNEHFGLDKIKDRIIEHLAVLKLKGDMKAPILCFVGPPGVGKTSLGKSIAHALGRKYIRMALGGLHDEAEIRGHRKTYIGAMPGRILQNLKKASTNNPVFVLDEIDKVGKDFRGDPSSALLEVLDPEQNSTFHDNYIDTEFDLSKVMFIATANSLQGIQPALLDRMEIIELSGYSVEEKVEIAKRHIVSLKATEHGLKPKQVKFNEESIQYLISHFTRESGVRELGRIIGSCVRKAARKVAQQEAKNVTINIDFIKKELGKNKFENDDYLKIDKPGVAIGLAWTPVGGDILYIESNKSTGNGKLTLTGNLGDVMKESATTALSFLKSNMEIFNLKEEDFTKQDFHIHIPEGAIPKDGPSAGITMLTVLASVLTEKPIRPYLAMSGEITLRGKVLPVGGIKEKILAAKRSGIHEIILCEKNRRDVDEINQDYISELKFIYVSEMKEVLTIALKK
jgi:ATP-dependent Lon protease